ncbi:helix-turn-helix transcriptional regulator [Sphingobacterium phlebotomi]|uniref:Helix-turn-helix transcriptional regulator n=1 Tax=Sphingobacterium phlebotomi TaxID=2605433 RepID=A0A5D4HB67_9SPHI|nr:helix-turn-helix transcriptional regulator [Sphingobacterium phlebotomi]TYR37443.1 helix-turn-helix transcriptional regulator [Sphingobacterium phlebotomi]
MKIGQKIKDLRSRKGYSSKFVAEEIGISEEEYLEIENGGDVLWSVVEAIANRLSTNVVDLMLLDESPFGIRNYFNNNNGNQGKIINVQTIDQEEVRNAYKELYFEQVKRIPKLEKLLLENNIEFDF